MEVVIIGNGHFGSALHFIYQKKGLRVSAIGKTDAWPDSKHKQIALLCVPTQFIPDAVAQRLPHLNQCAAVISTAKGIIRNKQVTPSQWLKKSLKKGCEIFVLSGPSFASEIRREEPTALVLASQKSKLQGKLSQLLTTPALRLYNGTDPYGVEFCGALKNIYAIAAGVAKGIGLGDNARAALLTRCLAEMNRISVSLGAKHLTCFGLAGVGDLVLTCSSEQSRNFQFGLGLAQGIDPINLLQKLGTVEGVWTAAVAHSVCTKKKIRTPILDTTKALIDRTLKPKEAVIALMARKTRHEFE